MQNSLRRFPTTVGAHTMADANQIRCLQNTPNRRRINFESRTFYLLFDLFFHPKPLIARIRSLQEIQDLVNKSRVMVTVFYEALCPDSRSFFVRHLLPTFLKMRNSLKLELVPYGKATVSAYKLSPPKSQTSL